MEQSVVTGLARVAGDPAEHNAARAVLWPFPVVRVWVKGIVKRPGIREIIHRPPTWKRRRRRRRGRCWRCWRRRWCWLRRRRGHRCCGQCCKLRVRHRSTVDDNVGQCNARQSTRHEARSRVRQSACVAAWFSPSWRQLHTVRVHGNVGLYIGAGCVVAHCNSNPPTLARRRGR